MKRQTIGRLLAVTLVALISLTSTACHRHRNEGPAQAAGRNIDHGLDKTGDAVEDAGRKVNRALPGD